MWTKILRLKFYQSIANLFLSQFQSGHRYSLRLVFFILQSKICSTRISNPGFAFTANQKIKVQQWTQQSKWILDGDERIYSIVIISWQSKHVWSTCKLVIPNVLIIVYSLVKYSIKQTKVQVRWSNLSEFICPICHLDPGGRFIDKKS